MTGDPRPPTDYFQRFCECLNRYGADYVVVGSEAVAFHGAPRFSADFDTFVSATRANLFRVLAAIEAFGLAELAKKIDPELWEKTGATLRLGEVPVQIDLLLQLTGVDYPSIARRAVEGSYGEVRVRFIAYDDLVRNKLAVGRPKGLADVAALEQVKR